jgi:hypothetical protein
VPCGAAATVRPRSCTKSDAADAHLLIPQLLWRRTSEVERMPADGPRGGLADTWMLAGLVAAGADLSSSDGAVSGAVSCSAGGTAGSTVGPSATPKIGDCCHTGHLAPLCGRGRHAAGSGPHGHEFALGWCVVARTYELKLVPQRVSLLIGVLDQSDLGRLTTLWTTHRGCIGLHLKRLQHGTRPASSRSKSGQPYREAATSQRPS